ncbi:hypothetical protein [Moritella yayanosii]|uniref:Uncharacterized protein n=1 Tax=Moritella yayanosii TaxID=69539 RepID=A0A330LRQ6_9GAMM|nr:hypothetical protein [Moritella yayanosii]SQD76785.1 protein of unknown function [Moritella yayanosii]
MEEDAPFSDERYFYAYDDGFSLLFEDEVMTAIHLFMNDDNDVYEPYTGWLGDHLLTSKIDPLGLETLMGEPSRRGGGEKGLMGKIDNTWLRYDYSDYTIHYTFDTSNSCIEMITIMKPIQV